MNAAPLIAYLAIAGTAGFVQGLFGLGYALIAAPLLALLVNYHSALVMVAVPMEVLAIFWIARHGREIATAGIPWWFFPGALVGTAAGAYVQVALSQRAALLLLAGLLTTSVVLPLMVSRWSRASSGRIQRAAVLFGALAGLTDGAMNAGAPIIVLFGGLARLSRAQLLSLLYIEFCFGKAVQLIIVFFISRPKVGGFALGLGIAASWGLFVLGDLLSGRFAERVFIRRLRVFLLLMSGILVSRALMLR